MSKIHPDFVTCCRVTAQPLASSSSISMKVVCLTKWNCMKFDYGVPKMFCSAIPDSVYQVCHQWFWLHHCRCHQSCTECSSSSWTLSLRTPVLGSEWTAWWRDAFVFARHKFASAPAPNTLSKRSNSFPGYFADQMKTGTSMGWMMTGLGFHSPAEYHS